MCDKVRRVWKEKVALMILRWKAVGVSRPKAVGEMLTVWIHETKEVEEGRQEFRSRIWH